MAVVISMSAAPARSASAFTGDIMAGNVDFVTPVYNPGLSGDGSGASVPVIDNLTSNSKTSALSANQGRALKALIDTTGQAILKMASIWYLSMDGCDTTGDGSEAAPWATLERALAQAAKFVLLRPLTIRLADGEYTLGQSLIFDHPQGSLITIAGAGGGITHHEITGYDEVARTLTVAGEHAAEFAPGIPVAVSAVPEPEDRRFLIEPVFLRVVAAVEDNGETALTMPGYLGNGLPENAHIWRFPVARQTVVHVPAGLFLRRVTAVNLADLSIVGAENIFMHDGYYQYISAANVFLRWEGGAQYIHRVVAAPMGIAVNDGGWPVN